MCVPGGSGAADSGGRQTSLRSSRPARTETTTQTLIVLSEQSVLMGLPGDLAFGLHILNSTGSTAVLLENTQHTHSFSTPLLIRAVCPDLPR